MPTNARLTSVVGSGFVVTAGLAGTAIALFVLGRVAGWDPTWSAFGVTPLQPPFFDMHVINDYAACAARGANPYAPQACNVDNFNIPPTWLWLGLVGVGGASSNWLSLLFIASAAIVMALLLRGRSWLCGVVAMGALVSPTVMMGVERGNLDLLILALVGTAALTYGEGDSAARAVGAVVLILLGVMLKLFPLFCISLGTRGDRRSLAVATIIAIGSLIYCGLSIEYLGLIRRNVPSTSILSYGYKAIFFGLDYVFSQARLDPIGLADTWLPAFTAVFVLVCAAGLATINLLHAREYWSVDRTTAGTAFLFGAGIYCGTYMLGTNFVYRLMFLLLCMPQILDWQARRYAAEKVEGIAELVLFVTIFGVLWTNGNAAGHSTFLLLPQLLNWFLFFCLASLLISHLLRTIARRGRSKT